MREQAIIVTTPKARYVSCLTIGSIKSFFISRLDAL